jgi:hypothetical protein
MAVANPAAPQPLLVAWRRAAADGPVEVFTGVAPLGRPAANGDVLLALPASTRGRSVPAGALPARLAELASWTRLAGISDGLVVAAQPARTPGDLRPSLEDGLLRVWREPFAWLVLAEPIGRADVAREADAVAEQERAARSRSSSPEQSMRAGRLEHRHRELRQAESTGLWRIHLLAGGADPPAAAAVAGLLCASADLTDLPYTLVPTASAGGFEAVLDAAAPPHAPFVGSSLLLAALATGPAEEVPGMRLVRRPEFDVVPETAAGGIVLGRVLDRNGVEVDDFAVAPASLTRHTFVCGATGAGKSQTVRHLLERASATGVPWLVVEPAKAEYRRMADRLGPHSVVSIRPGERAAAPIGLNPLEPAPGFPLQTHADLVRALFLAAFEAEEPFPQVLAAALTRCYEEQGWDLALGEPRRPGAAPRYPTLRDLQRVAEQVVMDIGYGREVTDNVRGFVKVRLASLRLGTTGRFFDGGHPIDFPKLMRSNVVFEIEDVGDDRDKAFFIGTVLVRLVEHLRTAVGSSERLRHLSVFEEAHRLLRRIDRPGPASHAVELFAALLAEIRAYGEGLVIAEQIPSKLIPDVIKNTAVKVIHRLPALDDRDTVGATVNLSPAQSEYVITLPPGTAAAFSDGMDNPVLVRMPDGTPRETGAVAALPPDLLAGRRSPACGVECRTRACTLADMSAARHLLADPDSRWLAFWAELAVVAHLTGWPTPRPLSGALHRLRALGGRTVACAIAHAVGDAVAARTAAVVEAAAPDGLLVHVAAALRGRITNEGRCAAEEPDWLARPYRWVLLRDSLVTYGRAGGSGRHPRSAEWEASYGTAVPGETWREQCAAVIAWYNADQRDRAAVRTVLFGHDGAAAIQAAVGCRTDDPQWTETVRAELRRFHACRWPLRYLAPSPATPSPVGSAAEVS